MYLYVQHCMGRIFCVKTKVVNCSDAFILCSFLENMLNVDLYSCIVSINMRCHTCLEATSEKQK